MHMHLQMATEHSARGTQGAGSWVRARGRDVFYLTRKMGDAMRLDGCDARTLDYIRSLEDLWTRGGCMERATSESGSQLGARTEWEDGGEREPRRRDERRVVVGSRRAAKPRWAGALFMEG